MTLRDRGNIKWTSLMLVEHKKRLKELKRKEADKEELILDQQSLEKLNYLLNTAYNKQEPIKIIYYQTKRYHAITGIVSKIDSFKARLLLETKEGQKNLALSQIKDIMIK